MKSIGRRATIIVAAVAGLAVLAGGWFLLVKPVRSDISKVKAQTTQQQSDNDSSRLQLQSMQSIAKHLPAEKAELAVLSQRVPNQVELPAILRSMQALAKASGVTLATITPAVPTPLTGAPGIDTVAINLAVSGGYAEVEQFDSALEGLQRTFLVSGFTLTGSGGTSGAGTPAASTTTTITATFTGRVLVHTTAPAATTGTATAATASTTATAGH
ncbi:MAG TPA: type 4a pilus biogenesis protein PilO [Frankiaceae bacterium]|jgi:Tfp pilus assembly protein PilO|nr:type 4a pilus biogenesis protein PilO [Frankiaceae bacterium]